MVRFLLSVLVNLVAAALAFLFTSWLVSGFNLSVGGFFLAVVIFAALQSVLSPLIFNVARKYASTVLGGVGLIATLLALWITTLVSGALSINGVSAWISSMVVVWLVSVLVTWLLDFVVLRSWWDRRQSAHAENAAADAALARREAKKK
ncbi:hypothetical protein GOHSU_16_01240 [Gordonia hirsuta DSM 44140 = NBRC 16056]|uniref:Phage holin family protein n=1 Tax=Gordonia hirsuta DSM 44140 = NBRC 16056 TaxID=1121927 RepID=L7L8T8_9ACTN|nr:phage holin family protein [Gordonia hirsuta]GAC57166.1 hypothetical protein GOHSU_16_01240 [Gordonia hirsuta DSM 44140 = NBRC 16056]